MRKGRRRGGICRWVALLAMASVGLAGAVHARAGTAAVWPLQRSGGDAQTMSVTSDEIVNGVLDGGSPSVGLFDLGGATCTATLIGCRTVLTAAHCVCADGVTVLSGAACTERGDLLDPANKLVFFQHSGLYGVSGVSVHPSFQFGTRSDLAVLHLSEPVTGIRPARINQTARPATGSPGLVVGFGRIGGANQEVGVKRQGLVRTAPCQVAPDSTHLCWDFLDPVGAPGEDSSTCHGDSGGPLFVDLGAGLRLAGVASGVLGVCLAPNHPLETDVFVDRAWIASVAGTDLHRSSCGSLPFAGEADAPILSGSGTLSAGEPAVRFELDVPAGVGLLRVTLNGVRDALDGDLFVRRGVPATRAAFDCASTGPESLEACEVSAPQPGTWHLLAERFGGSGAFQVTATLFESSGGGGGDTSPCIPDEFTLCAVGGRFEIMSTAPRSLFPGLAGRVSPVIDGDLGGAFHYFAAEKNFHTVVKVALRPSGFYAVSAVALDPLEWTVRVRDTLTGEVKSYTNPAGGLGVPTDVQAFAADPEPPTAR